jgi:hypothetical protein
MFKKGTNDLLLIVCTLVDDVILARRRDNQEATMKFDVEFRDESDLSQTSTIEKLATRLGIDNFKGRDPHMKLGKAPKDRDITSATWDYQSTVGELLYFVVTVRLFVACAVGVLSRFMSCPGQEHIEAAMQVIGYLYGTNEFGIMFCRSAQGSPHAYVHSHQSSTEVANSVGDIKTIFGTYADADLAGDKTTRRSTSGYCIVIYEGFSC